MKVEVRRETPRLPPITEVIIRLSLSEAWSIVNGLEAGQFTATARLIKETIND